MTGFKSKREAALAQPVQEIDWKDQYEKQKRRSEMWIAKYEKDIGTLEKAGPVAQPAQKPVAWMHEWADGERIPLLYDMTSVHHNDKPVSVRPLVFGDTPPQRPWVGLTDEEVLEAMSMSMNSNVLNQKVYKAIEAKLKEKNA